MNDLQLCIRLSIGAVAAFDRADYTEARRLRKERDELYLRLSTDDARLFGAWSAYEFTPEQAERFLETGDRVALAITKPLAAQIATAAQGVADHVARASLTEAADLYAATMFSIVGTVGIERPPVTQAACDAFSIAVAGHVGPARCRDLHGAMLTASARWLQSVEHLMGTEQLAEARGALDRMRAGGWSVPERARS